jgi:hypothetical protein
VVGERSDAWRVNLGQFKSFLHWCPHGLAVGHPEGVQELVDVASLLEKHDAGVVVVVDLDAKD